MEHATGVAHSYGCNAAGIETTLASTSLWSQEQALQVARVTKIIDPGTDDTKQLGCRKRTLRCGSFHLSARRGNKPRGHLGTECESKSKSRKERKGERRSSGQDHIQFHCFERPHQADCRSMSLTRGNMRGCSESAKLWLETESIKVLHEQKNKPSVVSS